jgi:hypothetical protein
MGIIIGSPSRGNSSHVDRELGKVRTTDTITPRFQTEVEAQTYAFRKVVQMHIHIAVS